MEAEFLSTKTLILWWWMQSAANRSPLISLFNRENTGNPTFLSAE